MATHTLIIIICSIVTVVLALGGVAVKWILKEISSEASNRNTSATAILKQQADIKADLKAVTDGHDKRLDRLEQHSGQFMPRDQIISAMDHEKASRSQLGEAMMKFYQKCADDIVAVRVEVGKLQTEHGNLANIVGDIKSLLREQRQEANDRLDAIQRQEQQHFDQVCQSLREISKRESRG